MTNYEANPGIVHIILSVSGDHTLASLFSGNGRGASRPWGGARSIRLDMGLEDLDPGDAHTVLINLANAVQHSV